MPWYTKRGRRFYYRNRSVSARGVSTHIGGGLIGELAATFDAWQRAERRAAIEALRDEQATWRQVESPLAELCRGTDQLLRSRLMLAGYYRHARNEWRRRGHGR